MSTLLSLNEIHRPVHFIDIGANVGQTCSWVKTYYGKILDRIDSFEPQQENLDELRWAHGTDRRITIHCAAAWVSDCFHDFYPQLHGCRTGSSLIRGKSSTDTNILRVVQCIDIVEWVKKNTDRTKNHVIFKLDTEGAEFEILPYFLDSGAYDLVDEMFIEFHAIGKVPNYSQDIVDRVKNECCEKFTNWGKMCETVESYRNG